VNWSFDGITVTNACIFLQKQLLAKHTCTHAADKQVDNCNVGMHVWRGEKDKSLCTYAYKLGGLRLHTRSNSISTRDNSHCFTMTMIDDSTCTGWCWLNRLHAAIIHRHNMSDSLAATVNYLDSKGNYSATSNNTKLVHWPFMGGLLHLVHAARRGLGGPLLAVPNVTDHITIHWLHCIAIWWSVALRF